MTPAKVAQLSAILLNAGVGYTVSPAVGAAGDWVVTCAPGGAFDISQVAAVETQLGVTSPITGSVTLV